MVYSGTTIGSVGVADALGGAVSGNADLVLFVVIGALGGAHCLGMCGPLVSTYADRITAQRETSRRRLTLFDVRQHALFNLGRTAGYALVGAVLGALGGAIGRLGGLMPATAVIRGGMGVVVGALIVAAGIGYLSGATMTATVPLSGLGSLFERVTGRLTAKIDRFAGSTGIAGLGVIHAMLPCPILFPAYLYAFVAGDPIRGTIALALLGLGTLPTLLVYGLALGSLSVTHRRVLHRAMGAAFLILGLLPLAHGLALLGVDVPVPRVPYYQPL